MSRTCPMCNSNDIPVYRALCRHCFDVMPWRTRADFLAAWRLRAAMPMLYQEQYVRTKQIYDELPHPRRKDCNTDDDF